MARVTTTIERTYDIPVEELWELWTTKAGIEAWWGPEGYTVKVQELDFAAGGELRYTLTATAGEQVAQHTRSGKPLSRDVRIRYNGIAAPHALSFVTVDASEIETTVELSGNRKSSKMIVRSNAPDARTGEIKKLTFHIKQSM